MKNKENQLDNLFDKARYQTPETSSIEVINKFKESVSSGYQPAIQSLSNSINLTKWIIMILSIGAIATTIMSVDPFPERPPLRT